jgi:L-ribulokinase
MAGQPDDAFSIGVDYGTNSVRALIVACRDGREVASASFDYPTGSDGVIVDSADPNLARQHPGDYLDGFRSVVAEVVTKACDDDAFEPDRIVGIGIDTTGSTPIPIDEHANALGTDEAFRDEPAAQAWLWKDHTSHAEAAEITETARRMELPYLAKCGETYSSEWFWSKILHCRRVAPKVFEAAAAWVEFADFVPARITGVDRPESDRSRYLRGRAQGDVPRIVGRPAERGFPHQTRSGPRQGAPGVHRTGRAQRSRVAGRMTAEYAEATGLRAGLPVAVGALDAHHGAVGAGIRPGTLVKIMGTSTCDIIVGGDGEAVPDIPGVCGVVPGSVIPGLTAIEAGQSAVGDIFNWFVNHLGPKPGPDAHAVLTIEAARLRPGASGLLALDWNNGNRTVLVDPLLSGLLVGTTLHTTAAEVYRALIEATAFGALMIINRCEEYGVAVREVVNCGGIAEKNPLVMQIYADVCNRPMKVSRSAQTCALGAAIFGAVVGGAHADTRTAQDAMVSRDMAVYEPIADHVGIYEELFGLYQLVHDGFGAVRRDVDLGSVMKRLIEIRTRERQA